MDMYEYMEQDVKHVTIALQRLSASRVLERRFADYPTAKEQAIEMSKHVLLDGVRKFIATKEEDRGHEIIFTSTLGLPHVYDSVIQEKDGRLAGIVSDLSIARASNVSLRARIAYLELPWYEKLKHRLFK